MVTGYSVPLNKNSAIHSCGEFAIIKAKWYIAETVRREDSGSIPDSTTLIFGVGTALLLSLLYSKFKK